MTYMITWSINADVRATQLHSGPGRGHGLEPILESLNTWSIDTKRLEVYLGKIYY